MRINRSLEADKWNGTSIFPSAAARVLILTRLGLCDVRRSLATGALVAVAALIDGFRQGIFDRSAQAGIVVGKHA